ncbi:MAG TPA: YciI family protein [Vicinamibacterales bacterium]|nr:YciI family protein [Vicinamibacterales bacterium]
MSAMRFIIMHKTSPRWEAGEVPSQELIVRVGALIGELARTKLFQEGEGLRASSLGVRLTFSGGTCAITKGPFKGEHELSSGFSILRVASLDEAVEWATRAGRTLGDGQLDIRPVTEPWDIGMSAKPTDVATTRYMVLRKATPASEAGEPLPERQRQEIARLIEESSRAGTHLATHTMKPSARGRRYKNSGDGLRVLDGPFTESKELIAGYIIVAAGSRDEADRWAMRYLDTVEANEVDLRELDEAPTW